MLAPRGYLGPTRDGVLLRPVVGVDIDGSMALWHEHFLWFASQYLGRPMPLLYMGSEPLYKVMGVSKATYRQIKLAYRQSGLKRAMRAQEGAVELARGVRALGAELWVCTTRPYLRLDNIDPDTRHWLRRNGITYDGVLFGERKYRDFARLVGSSRVVAVFEDLPEQVRAAQKEGLPAYRIDRPYNRFDVGDMPFVADLREALVVVRAQLAQWKERHGV